MEGVSRCLSFLLMLVYVSSLQAEPWDVRRVTTVALPNAYRLHADVLSGGLPEDELGFIELKKLGVKTIISVDGANPNVEMARRHGLRYVHLPHGYDGIETDHALRLAKAIRELPKPIYIHCHHGKHRSPAAAIVASVGAGLLPSEQNLQLGFLQTAGTSEHYIGLYSAAKLARPFPVRQLTLLQVEFKELVEVPPLAKAMVEIDETNRRLSLTREAGWRTSPESPDVEPAHEALILKEHFRELLRAEKEKQSPEFLKILENSADASAELESQLRESPSDLLSIQASWLSIQRDCRACHRDYRDRPLR